MANYHLYILLRRGRPHRHCGFCQLHHFSRRQQREERQTEARAYWKVLQYAGNFHEIIAGCALFFSRLLDDIPWPPHLAAPSKRFLYQLAPTAFIRLKYALFFRHCYAFFFLLRLLLCPRRRNKKGCACSLCGNVFTSVPFRCSRVSNLDLIRATLWSPFSNSFMK